MWLLPKIPEHCLTLFIRLGIYIHMYLYNHVLVFVTYYGYIVNSCSLTKFLHVMMYDISVFVILYD